jgi:hypothetical protein
MPKLIELARMPQKKHATSIRRVQVEARPPWRVHFFKRHVEDDPEATVPARDFLDRCPTAVAPSSLRS